MSRKSETRNLVVVPMWTRAQAEKASPYLASMLRSLRESLIEAKQHGLSAHRLASKPGRPNRTARIAHADALRDACRAIDAVRDGIEELLSLGINCPDPLRGEALLPFAKDEQLAWFMYDLFAEEPLRHWRFHVDPPQTRRSIEEIPYSAEVGRSSAGQPPGAIA